MADYKAKVLAEVRKQGLILAGIDGLAPGSPVDLQIGGQEVVIS